MTRNDDDDAPVDLVKFGGKFGSLGIYAAEIDGVRVLILATTIEVEPGSGIWVPPDRAISIPIVALPDVLDEIARIGQIEADDMCRRAKPKNHPGTEVSNFTSATSLRHQQAGCGQTVR